MHHRKAAKQSQKKEPKHTHTHTHTHTYTYPQHKRLVRRSSSTPICCNQIQVTAQCPITQQKRRAPWTLQDRLTNAQNMQFPWPPAAADATVCVCVCLSLCSLRFRVSLCVSLCPEMATEISTQRDSSRDITPKRGREDKSGQARFCARGDGEPCVGCAHTCTQIHTNAQFTIHKGSKGRIDQKRKGIKQWSIHYNTHLSAGFERPPAERRIGIPPPRESDDAVRDRNALP
jgi:hypothetical protein